MSFLNVNDARSSRSGRSKSRNRDRSRSRSNVREVEASRSAKPVSISRSSTSHPRTIPPNGTSRGPGTFSPVESPKQTGSGPSFNAVPGLASLATAGLSSFARATEPTTTSCERQKATQRYSTELRSPSELTMPAIPSDDAQFWPMDLYGTYSPHNAKDRALARNLGLSEHRSTVTMPSSRLQYPDDDFEIANMPGGGLTSITGLAYTDIQNAASYLAQSPSSQHLALPAHLVQRLQSTAGALPYPFSDDQIMEYAEIREKAPSERIGSIPYLYSTNERRARDLSVGNTEYKFEAQPRKERMTRLSMNGNRPDGPHLRVRGAVPSSPVLGIYQSTYQTMPSMPSTFELASDDFPDLSPLSPNLSEILRRSDSTYKKRVQIYDAGKDAEILIKGLSHRQARSEPLIAVLPGLSHDQLLELQDEYKKRCRTGGHGVSLTKHIKATTSGHFGMICYVTSLGRWESEAYWANFWYKSHATTQNLLIETLMGRTNAEIKQIKERFSDQLYSDDLMQCMEKELKPGKFQEAVLIVLAARRQEDTDSIVPQYVERDMDILRQSLEAKQGGERSILQVVITRSDAHLREVLKAYERTHESNFAREALKRSKNSAGEIIAHVLNGVINRPVRDALLLRQVIENMLSKSRPVEQRYELLTSRLVRLHWDRVHFGRVKDEYRARYLSNLGRDLKDVTTGDFGDFCIQLCEA